MSDHKGYSIQVGQQLPQNVNCWKDVLERCSFNGKWENKKDKVGERCKKNNDLVHTPSIQN